jgi:hypothetical protein
MGVLDAALLRLDKLTADGGDDPLNLDEYQRTLAGIKSSRGKAIRHLVYDTFRRFFNGPPVASNGLILIAASPFSLSVSSRGGSNANRP